MSNEAVANDLCKFLNEMTAIDPLAMYRLVHTRTPCKVDVWHRLTERLVCDSDMGPLVGMLGLINGWLANASYALVAENDNERSAVKGFVVEWRGDAIAAPTEDAAPALSLACAHCGPESAGPAQDNPKACATCCGDLILTDADGAALLHRWYGAEAE